MNDLAERQREMVTALAGELATVVSALVGTGAKALPSDAPPPRDWMLTCSLTGSQTGQLTLAVSQQDAATIASRLLGMTEAPGDDAVMDTLSEVAGQAAGGLGQLPVAGGARVRVDGAPVRDGALPKDAPAVFAIVMDDATTVTIACWARLEAASVAEPEAPAPGPAPASSGTGAASQPGRSGGGNGSPENLDVILDIELPLTVRFGRTEMSLQALTRVGPGSVIDLDRSPDEPVEVLINDKVIARGEVVVVAGNYGVRVTEITSAVERIRTMGN